MYSWNNFYVLPLYIWTIRSGLGVATTTFFFYPTLLWGKHTWLKTYLLAWSKHCIAKSVCFRNCWMLHYLLDQCPMHRSSMGHPIPSVTYSSSMANTYMFYGSPIEVLWVTYISSMRLTYNLNLYVFCVWFWFCFSHFFIIL